jgi:inosose dehydratase
MPQNRREFFQAAFAATAGSSALAASVATAASATIIRPPPLGFSLYGMKQLPLDEAIKACADIGYDGVELALMPGFPTDPQTFGKEDRRRLPSSLGDLEVCGLMENLTLAASDAEHRKNLDRIARAAELAHDINAVKVMETVLGGKPDDWPNVRGAMADRLRDWGEAARKHDINIALKPHVSGAVHRPEACKQLLDDVNLPGLWAVYDYSHYQVQGLKLKETFDVLADRVLFVHVKDGRRVDGKVQFLLPGDGDTDYKQLFGLVGGAVNGIWVTVEVSAQLSNRPDYDAIAAAKRSFKNLTAAFE